MNIGERAELEFIATLGCFLGQTVKFANMPNSFTVSDVGIPNKKTKSVFLLKKFSSSMTPSKIKAMTNFQLEMFCHGNGIVKAGQNSKSDVYINGEGYSVKSFAGSPPAIINHTNRMGLEKVAQRIGISINALDTLVNDYWVKRINNIIGEDIKNSDANSPFSAHISILQPFLNYFCFDGTGQKKSDHPANYVVEFSDICDQKTWEIFDRNNYLPHIWSKLYFSLRSKKGMPKNINTLSQAKQSSVMMWSRTSQNSLKGALHVRVSNA